MVSLRTLVLACWALCISTAGFSTLAHAQDLKTINKPGAMTAAVTTKDKEGQPLKLKKGEKVTVIYSRDDWMWVQNKKGKGAWVLKKEVKVNEDVAAAPPAEEARKKPEEKKAPAEDTKRRKEEEAAAKKAAAEEARQKKDDEAAARRLAADDAKKKRADEEAARHAAEEEARRRKAEEEAALRKPAVSAPVAAVQPEPAPAPQPARSAPQPARAAPAPAPSYQAGFVSVVASESKAEVSIDGRAVGYAPLRTQLEGGRHQVVVSKDRFNASTQEVLVNGDETKVTLALAPTPEAVQGHRMGVFRNWGLGLVALVLGGVGAVLWAGAGLGGALLWIAAASASIGERAQVDYTDPVTVAVAPILTNPVFQVLGAAITVASPLLGLLLAGGFTVAGGALLATAGDPGRYSAYQE